MLNKLFSENEIIKKRRQNLINLNLFERMNFKLQPLNYIIIENLHLSYDHILK